VLVAFRALIKSSFFGGSCLAASTFISPFFSSFGFASYFFSTFLPSSACFFSFFGFCSSAAAPPPSYLACIFAIFAACYSAFLAFLSAYSTKTTT